MRWFEKDEDETGVSFSEGLRVEAMDKGIIVRERGRGIGAAQVAFIRGLIALEGAHEGLAYFVPAAGRWKWRQANGRSPAGTCYASTDARV